MSGFGKKQKTKSIMHTVMGLLLMFLFFFLQPFHPLITRVGMRVLGVFLGTLFLWITEGGLWPSLLCVAMLCLTGYGSVNAAGGAGKVLSSFLGNPTMMLILFIMILSEALEMYGVTTWIAGKILAAGSLKDRPWRMIIAISVTGYLMAIFINPFTPIFLFWPILEEIFRQTGFRKDGNGVEGDLLPKLMFILITAVAVIGYAVPAYMGTPLVLVNTFGTLAEGKEQISIPGYFAAAFLTGLCMTLAILAVTRYLVRPDVSLLAEYKAQERPEKLTSRQKILGIGFIVMVILMLVPSLLPQNRKAIRILTEGSFAMPLIMTTILALIPLEDGAVLDASKTLSGKFNWNSYFLCGAAILIGGALTDSETGISASLQEVLQPVLEKMTPTVFLFLAALLCVVITNFCNSLVVMLIMEPVIRSYCNIMNCSGVLITTVVMMMTLMTALFTPAASPFAAILHGNTGWLKKRDIYRYTLIYVATESAVIMTAGLCLTKWIMKL